VVAPGERVAVTGPSGAGKTTLLAVLSGLERPDAGTVLVAGHDPTSADPVALRRSVGLVLQGYGLVPLLTAEENVELVLRDAGTPGDDATERTAAALEQVGLAARAEHLVEELSGGEQQRVAVARALAARPAVLFADEPTAALDAATRSQVLDLVLAVAEHGVAVVLATHDPAVAARCDRELHVHAGAVEERVGAPGRGSGR
jgi:predicted ABC-type transport system involved in lysophospholipase L1 biosynthesis ATPase subunit